MDSVSLLEGDGIGMVRNVPFWLSDEQWCWTEPHLTTNWRRTGGRSTRHQWDRAFAEEGYRWCDRPPEYGPHLTIYNRFGFRQGRYLRRASRPNLRHLDNQAPQRAWPLRSSIPSGLFAECTWIGNFELYDRTRGDDCNPKIKLDDRKI
jgi:hypothetical protein